MKLGLLLGVGAAAMVALSALAVQAQVPVAQDGWYIGPEGGWTNLPSTSFTGGGTTGIASFDDGYNVGARLGYMTGPWRFEGEFNYRHNAQRSASVSTPLGSVSALPGGDRHSFAEMFNVLYDVNLDWPVTPHIGAGIGASEQTSNSTFPGPGNASHSTVTEFAYQAIGGLRWMACSNVAVDLDYRYFATTDPTFTAANGTTAKTRYATHNFVASVSWLFGAPPPPPIVAPAPPPVAPKVFIVFFDWDKDTITPEGQAIIQQAADAWRSGAPVQIQVTGYTDRSGSAGYNQRLSERRANNVARAMAALGVPKASMIVSGRGENDNRVPTANGVREPQNRRVEIVSP